MTTTLIPTAAVVALEESTTHMDFSNGDGWVMSRVYALHVLSSCVLSSCSKQPRTSSILRRFGQHLAGRYTVIERPRRTPDTPRPLGGAAGPRVPPAWQIGRRERFR